MDPEDKDYVCTLTEYSLEKAKRELNEDPKQRLGAVSTLRAWIRAQPHFTYRTDTAYLLQVLRTAKFSQLRAREIVEAMVKTKSKYPLYFENIDTHHPSVVKFAEWGVIIPLPKLNSEGQQIIIVRYSASDISDPLVTPMHEARAGFAVQELLKDENGIVNGAHMICDMTGTSLKYFTREGTAELREASKLYQDYSTGRIKGIHLYNGGSLVEIVVGMAKTFMKKKMIDRIHVHSNMESLYKIFPMELWPDEYLPDDYNGPSAGSIQSIIDNTKVRLMEPEFRAKVLDITHERYRMDTTKKDISIPQESFRKLNID